ncbi:sterol desaturase family protein [Chryseobacterium sp. CT-SW4]|uniref:sterol desaturase family protein n=1 Tax=Chryseobacterium sp. SW-1 TaxID=3157343 RepID=UPI003B0281D1
MEIISKILELTLSGIARYLVITIPVFAVFYIILRKYFKNLKIQEREAKRKDFIREIGNSLVSSLVMAVVAALTIFTPLIQYTQFYTGDEYPFWWSFVAAFIALVVHDTYFYWMHRIVHHRRIFKHVHLTHHKSTNPSPFASYSFHAFEAIAEALILPIVLFIIPMNPWSVFLFILGGFIINVYGHLGFEIMPKWFRHSFLFEVLNTSTHHNMHHSKFKGNYGLYLRVWDRMMGTEHPDYVKTYDKIQAKRFGKDKDKSISIPLNPLKGKIEKKLL